VTPERWQRIKQVFGGATALPNDARAKFLDDACADDEALRAEVDSLLAHSRDDAVVDRPAAEYVTGSAFESAPQWLGARLGPYELTALLGHGGMGEVYRARRVDAEYDKEVAIKLVPAGYQAQFVLQRLRTERQILATLEHPNIARLIDGGASPQGTPYLVMELVDGQPIDRYCADLPLPRRLDLFREVCGAVSYAHQRLVVHRDLKPGNILVTADGQPKLLDFGIAKLLGPVPGDHTLPQATMVHSFTPGFASPEQVLGQPITTASDVYSLGVLLYLMITGRSPYRGRLDTAADAIREICEGEPAAPAASPDLDAIVLRALRKEPSKRYASVEAFSNDVHRYLRGLPVVARGDRFSYRAGKFLRRHRLQVGAAALVLAALLGATIVSVREARIADAERARAEKHFASVRELADTFMFEVHDAISPLPGSTAARSLLVKTSLEYLNTLAAEAGDDPALQLDLANAYLKVGHVLGQAYASNEGRQGEALESYGKAAALAERIVAADPVDVAALRVWRDSLRARGLLILQFGETEEAVALSARAVDVAGQVLAITADPLDESEVGRTLSVHGTILGYAGRAEESVRDLRRSVDILEDLRRRHPQDTDILTRLGIAYTSAGVAARRSGPRDAAVSASVDFNRKALEVDSLLLNARPGDREKIRAVLASRNNLANLGNLRGQYAEALAECLEGQALVRQLNADPVDAQKDMDSIMLNAHCAGAYYGLGRFADAEALARSNLARLERMEREADNLYVQFNSGMYKVVAGRLAGRRGDCGGARDSFESALAHFEKVTSKVSLDLADRAFIDAAKAGLARCGGKGSDLLED
jgi:tetratricopeptide (TPR) repeat protein